MVKTNRVSFDFITRIRMLVEGCAYTIKKREERVKSTSHIRGFCKITSRRVGFCQLSDIPSRHQTKNLHIICFLITRTLKLATVFRWGVTMSANSLPPKTTTPDATTTADDWDDFVGNVLNTNDDLTLVVSFFLYVVSFTQTTDA